MIECKHKRFKFIGKKSDCIEISWCEDCGSIRETLVDWRGGHNYTHREWKQPDGCDEQKKELEELKKMD